MSYTPSGPPNDPRPAQDPYAQRQRSSNGPEPVTTADPIVWSTPEPSRAGGGWQGPAAFAPGPAPPEDAPAHSEPPEEPVPRAEQAQDVPASPAEPAEAEKAQQEKPPRDPTPVPPSPPPTPVAAEPSSGTAQSAGQTTPSSDDALTIGRSKTNSIVLDDMLVSRRHLRIAADDEGLVLEDLGSRNGTFVNGRRVQRTHLHEGDRIGVGSSTFEVRDGWLVSV